jgi:hypothetical protein
MERSESAELWVVARDDDRLDRAVREAEQVRLAKAERRERSQGVAGHELVGELRRAARGLALRARVDGHDRPTRRADGVDHLAKDAVLLSVAVEHEHRVRHLGSGICEVRVSRACERVRNVRERGDLGTVGHGHEARRGKMCRRQEVGTGEVELRTLGHGGLLRVFTRW